MQSAKMLVPTVPATDQDRADNFYKEVLGFSVSDKEMPGGTVLVGPGDIEVFVYKTDAKVGEATLMSFAVGDFDAAVKDITDAGIELESYDGMPGETDTKGVYGMDGAKVAWFKDTEGNTLNIFST